MAKNSRRLASFVLVSAGVMLWTMVLQFWHRAPENLRVSWTFSQPEEDKITRTHNNNISYPLTPQSKRQYLTQPEADSMVSQLATLREKQIFGPVQATGFNYEELERLVAYLSSSPSSSLVRPKIILASWHWIPCAFSPDCTPGEAQWMRSLIEIIRDTNGPVFKNTPVFMFYSRWEEFRRVWHQMGGDEVVDYVWADDRNVLWCFEDRVGCIRNQDNPQGIPPWKLFAFTFWGSIPGSSTWQLAPARPWSLNPLGSEWTLVPYQMPNSHFHLGYHYQRCSSSPFVPWEERKDQIVVLAKKAEYFHDSPVYDPFTFYTELRRRTGMQLIVNTKPDEEHPLPEGLTWLGPVSQEEYDLLLSSSKAVLGIGKPILSPTPYASLCHGVPFILPYRAHLGDRDCEAAPKADDWCGFDIEMHQHGPAGRIGEPWVYNVDITGDLENVYEAVETAVKTPIDSYEPPEMTYAAVSRRLRDYFSIDWEAYAKEKMTSKGIPEVDLRIEDWQMTWVGVHGEEEAD